MTQQNLSDDLETANDFSQQTGRNTLYQNHPEEIMADNVALLVGALAIY